MWTRIFHVCPHSMASFIFIDEKLVSKKLDSPLILFYFKRENKIRKKTLKKWLHSLGKTSLEKLEFWSRDQITYWEGSSSLSPKEVSND